MAHFDCRAGVFRSALEAESLVLWRVSDPRPCSAVALKMSEHIVEGSLGSPAFRACRPKDCNVNSASDAIKFSDAPMQVRKFNTIQKLHFGWQLSDRRAILCAACTKARIYLQTRDGLPMQRHQAYGSLITRSLGLQAALLASTLKLEKPLSSGCA